MIDDATANLFLEHLDSASPDDRNTMLDALQEYRDGAQFQQRQEQQAQQIRQLYRDPETLGGVWTKDMQDRLGPFQTNPQRDRAAWANTGFLALVNGKNRDEIATNYPLYRQQYAASNFNNGNLDDLGFYNSVKGQYDLADNKAALAQSLAGDAVSNAFTHSVEGTTPNYMEPFEAWVESNMNKPGFGPAADSYLADYRARYQASSELANSNRDLFTAARDLLVKQSGRTDTDAQDVSTTDPALEEAANRLSSSSPEERTAVYHMLGTWATTNYPKDPSGAVSRLAAFFANQGKALNRGVVSLSPKALIGNAWEVDFSQKKKALESGEPVFVRSGNPADVVADMATKTDMPSWGRDGYHEATPDERKALLAQVNSGLGLLSVSRELNEIAKSTIDPLRPVLLHGVPFIGGAADHVENAWNGAVEFAPTMAAGAIPTVGTPIMMAAMGNQEYDHLRLQYPDMEPSKAATIASLAGVGMGAIGSLRVAAVKGAEPLANKIPAVENFLKSLSTPTSSFWRSFAVKSAVAATEQHLELAAVNTVPAFTQHLISALDEDVPNVDWKSQGWSNLTSPETAITAMMFGLVGSGVASLRESRAVAMAVKSPEALMEAGIPEAKAREIASLTDPAEQEAGFRQAWQARTQENIAKGQKLAKDREESEKAFAASPVTPKLEAFGNQFRIVEPDGKVTATFDTPEAATQGLQDRLAWEQNGTAQAVRDLVAWYSSKDTARKWDITNAPRSLADETQASPETVAEQMRVAGYAAGADLSKIQVFGSNVADVKDGIYSDVSQIHLGATPLSVVHERTHSQAKMELANGTIKWKDAESAVRNWMGDKAPEKLSEEEVHEGIAQMGEEYFAGKMRQITGLPPSVQGFFARMAVYFKAVFQKAAQLLRLKKEGKLSADWEAFLARAVGLDETVAHNKAMEKAAGDIAGSSFSIRRSDFAPLESEQNAAKLDARKDEPIDIIEAKNDAPKSAQEAEKGWRESGVNSVENRDGITANVSAASVAKMVSGGKPFPRARMALVGSLKEAFFNAVPFDRMDDGRDPQVTRVTELFTPFRYAGDIYRARFLVKEFNESSGKGAKLHSARIQDIVLEKESARLEQSDGDANAVPSPASPGEMKVGDLFEGVNPFRGEETQSPDILRDPKASFSIAPATYADDLAKRFDALMRNPTARVEIYENAKRRLADIVSSNRADIAELKGAQESDQSVEIEREAILQGLDDKKQKLIEQRDAEISAMGQKNLGSFMDRIEAAQSDRAKQLLKREAKARGEEKAKAITSKYAERIKAVVKLAKEQVKSLESTGRAQQRADMSRARTLQSMAEYNAVLAAMPPEVRGRVGGFAQLADIKTDKGRAAFFEDRISRMDDELETLLRNDYRDRFDTLLDRTEPKMGDNKVRRSTLGPETQQIADLVRRVAPMTDAQQASEIASIEAKISAETDPKKLSELAQEWALVNQFGNIDGQSAEQLSASVANFRTLISRGKDAWRIKEEARLEDVKSKRETVLSTLGQNRPVTDSELQAAKEKGRTIKSKVLAYLDSNLSFAQALQELFRNADDKTALHFEDLTRQATNKYTDRINATHEQFKSDVNQLLGVKNLRERQKKLAALSEAKDTGVDFLEGRISKSERIDIDTARRAVSGGATAGNFSLDEIKTLTDALAKNDVAKRPKRYLTLERVLDSGNPVPQRMSELEAVHYLLSWDQPDVRPRMERQGISQDSIDGLRKWISPDAAKLMDWLSDRYKEGYDKLNPVYQRMYGMDMPRVKNYAPTFYDVAGSSAGAMQGPQDTTASTSGMTAGFIKSRTDHNAPLARVDALAAYWRHVVQSEYWRTWAEPVREMRGVLGNSEVLRAIRSKAGAAAEESTQAWLKVFETNGQKEAGMLRVAATLMQKVLAGNSAIELGFKLGVLMKQAGAALGSSMEIPASDAAAGWGRFMTGKLIKSMPEIWDTETIQRRIESGFSPEVRQVMQANGLTPSTFGQLAEKGLHLVGLADGAFTTISAAIAYDYHYREALKSGMGEAQAASVALDAMDRTVHRTAQPESAMDKSLNEVNAGVFAKAFMLFKSEARQKFAMSYLAAKRIARGENVAANAGRLLVTWVLAQAVTQTMGNVYQSIATDKDLESIWSWQDYLRAMLLGHLDGAYLIGPALSAALNGITHGHAFANKSQNPLDAIAEIISRKDFNPANWSDAADAADGMRLWLETGARVTGSDWLTGLASAGNTAKDIAGLMRRLFGK